MSRIEDTAAEEDDLNEDSNDTNNDEDSPSVVTDDILALYMNNFSDEDDDDTDFVVPQNVEEEVGEVVENDDEENVGESDFDMEELTALQKDLQEIIAESERDVYTQFLNEFNTDNEEETTEDDSRDVDYNTQQSDEPNEEYRTDPGANISKKEINSLLTEDPEERQERRGRKRSLHGTILTNSFMPTHIAPKPLAHSAQLIQLRPVTPVRADEGAMTVEQMTQLYEQLHSHYQLLASVLLFSKKENEPADVIEDVASKMTELKIRRDLSLDERRQKARNWYAVKPNTGMFTRSQKKKEPQVVPVEFPNLTILEVQGINMAEIYVHKIKSATADELSSIENIQANFIQPFRSIFSNPELEPDFTPVSEQNKIKLGRLKFTKAEDTLLAMGLARYGTARWELIRQNLLPTKTTAQLVNRYKNMSSTRAADEDNPIKKYKMSKKLPLSTAEIELMLNGVTAHGQKWDLISKRYLPHRTGTFLKKSYQAYRNKRPSNDTSEGLHVKPRPPQPINQTHFVPVNDTLHQHSHFPVYNFSNPYNQPMYNTLQTQYMENLKEKDDEMAILQDGININTLLGSQEEQKPQIVFEEEDIDSDDEHDIDDVLHNVPVEWSQDEDREILRASIEMGNSMNHLQIWEHLYNTKAINKDPSLIGARYVELVRLWTATMHK